MCRNPRSLAIFSGKGLTPSSETTIEASVLEMQYSISGRVAPTASGHSNATGAPDAPLHSYPLRTWRDEERDSLLKQIGCCIEKIGSGLCEASSNSLYVSVPWASINAVDD